MRRFLFAIFVLALFSVAPRADAQQACFGPTCSSGGSGSGTTTATVVGNALSCADAGGDDTYVCTLDPAITSMTNLTFTMQVSTGNTGAATVNVNGLGATAIKKAQGGVTTDPATNDIRAGAVIVLSYDGTNFQLQSTLGNAGAGTGDALTSSPLSQFAATTSLQFAGVISDETGSGAVVLGTSPTLVTPILGTPTSGTLTNATGLPVATGISGLGAGVASAAATPSSANVATAVTDETGSGSLVFATSPTLVTPILGTPTSGTLTNATGLPISTGVSGLGAGAATFLATPSSANLATAVTDETGSGALAFANTPTLVTPVLGAATGTSVNLSGGATVGAGVNYCADAGATDAYACSISPAPSAYSTGTIYTFKANTPNTGAATLDLNALGAKSIVKTAGGITTALSDNDIRAGSVVQVAYDGTNLQLVSPLANAAGGGTITGADTEVTFFDGANNPAGDADFTYNKTTNVATVAGAFRGPAGSSSAPAFAFSTATNYGFYLQGGSQLVMTINGVNRAIYDAGSNQFSLPVEPVGSLGTTLGRSGARWIQLYLGQTVTAGGTTGAQTINRATGTVNFAAAATSLVVTNSLVTTSSIIFTTIRTADTTCTSVTSTVPAAGSFTITLNAGCAAETSVGFLVMN